MTGLVLSLLVASLQVRGGQCGVIGAAAGGAAGAAAGLTCSEGAESSTSLISPRSPPDSDCFQAGPADSRSPPIRVTDSDG